MSEGHKTDIINGPLNIVNNCSLRMRNTPVSCIQKAIYCSSSACLQNGRLEGLLETVFSHFRITSKEGPTIILIDITLEAPYVLSTGRVK